MWKTASLLVLIVCILVTLGMVMLASTTFGSGDDFVKRQAAWLVIALVGGIFAAQVVDYHLWRKLAIPLAIAALVLLVLVLVPGIGKPIKGSWRWFRIGRMSLQPSELAKFAMVVFLAWWMEREQRHANEFLKGFLLPAIVLGFFLALVMAEPDFGTTMLMAGVGGSLLFLGGARVAYLLVSGAVGLSAFAFLVMQDEVRMRRVVAFIDPRKYGDQEAYQLLQAIYAFVSGGLTGTGLDQGLQKRYYLPEAHTDFIFAIVGEELGAVATISVVVLFFMLFVCGLIISLKAPDTFGRLLGMGLTLTITLQAILNMGVVTGCLPTKGLTLPYISFGGTSLLMSFITVGVLINIARHVIDGHAGDKDTRLIRDDDHWL